MTGIARAKQRDCEGRGAGRKAGGCSCKTKKAGTHAETADPCMGPKFQRRLPASALGTYPCFHAVPAWKGLGVTLWKLPTAGETRPAGGGEDSRG